MKFLIFSDLHIHNYKKFDKNGSRLTNCLKVLGDVFHIAHLNNIEHILFSGDLFDSQTNLPVLVINETVKTFTSLFELYPKIRFIAISGNHDNTSDIQNKSALLYLNEIFINFKLIDDDFFYFYGQNLTVWGIPYHSQINAFKSKLNDIPDKQDTILLIHQTPQEISNKHIPSDISIDLFSQFKMVFCGHIHKPEILKDNFIMVGSPLHRDRGDMGDKKGYWIYNTQFPKIASFFELKGYPKFSDSIDDENHYYSPDVLKTLNLSNLVEEDEMIESFNVAHDIPTLLENYCILECKDEERENVLQIGLKIISL